MIPEIPPGMAAALSALSEVFKTVLSDLYKNNPYLYFNYDNIIFHYTSSDILPCILSSDGIKLRFTDYRFLNDISEGNDFHELFKLILNQLHECKSINDDFFNEANNQYKELKPPQLFIACFSMNKDSLPLWNYYLKNGKYEGYSLGFDFTTLKDDKNISVAKVIYDDETKEKVIKNIITKQNARDDIDIKIKCAELMDDIQKMHLFMKRNCFRHEEEIRLVLNRFAVDDNPSDKYRCGNIEYYNRNGILQPFCDVTFNDTSIFKSCCFAPTMQKELAVIGLNSFLKSEKYDLSRISIFQSEIPVRY
ncbi:MAG: DUF2971 domain-containing protein [Ruminiclostridium sp.]|nr:DUF2971 domain-containing protein [Ruminiclostridium sp.]